MKTWRRTADLAGMLAVLACAAQAQPANDMFANRAVVSGTSVNVAGSNIRATSEPGEPAHADNPAAASVWWSWTAPSAGTVTISTAGSSFDTVLGVYAGSSVSELAEVASNDDENADANILTSKVVFNVDAARTYQIAVDGYNGDSGSIMLRIQLGPLQQPPQAPVWSLRDPNGAMVHSASLTGKVVLMDFWATWCGPCKAEMPDLVALQERYRADGLVIVGADVSWSGDSAQTVKSFLPTFTPAITYQVVMSDSAIEQAFAGAAGVPAIPDTFIMDRHNVIRKEFLGTQTRGTLERQIMTLLYEQTPLASRSDGNQTVLSWPNTAAPFTLESCESVVNPVWTAWPGAPTVVNGANTVQVPPSGAARFFRLRMVLPAP